MFPLSDSNSSNSPRMHHIAIMKSSWKLIDEILSSQKNIESRWYKTKRLPWNRIKPGDIIYFKDSGKPVTVKAVVTKVEQYEIKNNNHALQILAEHSQGLGITSTSFKSIKEFKKLIPKEILNYILNKKYAIFVYFDRVEKLKNPFRINKAGYGLQTAWITLQNINEIYNN